MSEKESSLRQILLCVAGMTPQIITETLYALTQERGERVDEIRVITTLAGRDRILRGLLAEGDGQFFTFCRDYGIDPSSIKFDETMVTLLRAPDGTMLKDIRTAEENECVANQICEIVRELTKDDQTRIHASAAGGRKTMSIYLTTAMQLFGRPQDRLSHVLVSEAFETHPDFFYIPPQPRDLRDRQGNPLSTAQAQIHLANIPFIRLRGVREEWLRDGKHSYGSLVARAQDDLDRADAWRDLRLDLRHCAVLIPAGSIKLPKREFFFYTLFAHLRQQRRGPEQDGFVALDEITLTDLEAVFRLITSVGGKERGLEDHDLVAGFDFLDGLVKQVEADFEEFQKTFLQVKSKLNRNLKNAELPDRYLLSTSGGYGATRYGLRFAPERISFS